MNPKVAVFSLSLAMTSLIISAISFAGEIEKPKLVFATAEKRLVAEQPTTRSYVCSNQGFMLSYRERIPGTDVFIEMIPIPAGKDDRGKPIAPFWMGRFEITVSQYRAYMKLHEKIKVARATPGRDVKPVFSVNQIDAVTAPTEVYDPSFRFEYGESDDSPMLSMTQYAARQYTKWLSLLTGRSYQLPTKSEWTHACRGNTDTKWSFGNDETLAPQYAVCWFQPKGEIMPQKVGSRQPNPFGLYDMHGNLSEWVIDDAPGAERYQTHLMCGGNWMKDPLECCSDSVIECDEEFWEEDPNVPLSPWWLAGSDAQMVGFRIMSPLVKPGLNEQQDKWNTDSQQLRVDLDFRIRSGRGSATVVTPSR